MNLGQELAVPQAVIHSFDCCQEAGDSDGRDLMTAPASVLSVLCFSTGVQLPEATGRDADEVLGGRRQRHYLVPAASVFYRE